MLLSHTTRCCCIQLSSNMLFSVSRNVAFACNGHQIRCFPYPKMLLLHTLVIKYIVSRIPKCCFCAHLSSNLLFPVSQNVAFAYNSYQICCFSYPKMLFLHTIVIKYIVFRIPKCCVCIQLSSNTLFPVSLNFVFAYNCHQIRESNPRCPQKNATFSWFWRTAKNLLPVWKSFWNRTIKNYASLNLSCLPLWGSNTLSMLTAPTPQIQGSAAEASAIK